MPQSSPADLLSPRQVEDLIVLASRCRISENMARGVGHLLSNVIQAMTVNAELGEETVEIGRNELEWMAGRVSIGHRILRRIGHPGEDLEDPVVISDVLTEVVEWERFQGGLAAADLDVHLEPGLPPAGIPGSELLHVLMELVTNAKQAAARESQARLWLAVEPGRPGMIRITVGDQGSGFDGPEPARYLDPFETTLGDQGRLGLGLAAVRILVTRRGGTIHLANGPSGALVSLEIPVWVPAPARRS